jgi:hypothetical protein
MGMRWLRPIAALLCSVAAAGCVAKDPRPAPPVRADTAAAIRPLPRLECTFDEGGKKLYRTYVVAKHQLLDEGPPRLRWHITSDDGETISAEHLDRGSKQPATVQISLRQHEAILTEPNADASGTRRLVGTCAQTT